MKTTLLAAVAAIGLGVTSAFAANIPSNGGYMYPDHWGDKAPQQVSAAVPAESNGASLGVYATQSGQGTWLFPPTPYGN